MQSGRKYILLAAIAAGIGIAQSAHATLSTGAGGSGVTAGASSLIGTYDYTDTFTGTDSGGHASRPYAAAVQGAPAYVIENTYSHPTANLQTAGQPAGVAAFSFAADGPGTPGLVAGSPTYPGTSGAGSDTGFTQTGGSLDYTAPYGFRQQYVVQFDAVLGNDRIDIMSGATPGSIFGTQETAGNLSIFIRATGGADLFNGTTDTSIPGFATGLTDDGKWHNFAVRFDQVNQEVQIYVDEQSKGTVNLLTFAGGAYANFSNANVGVGQGLGAGQNRTWTDNFQVGAVATTPEPTSIAVIGVTALGLLARRRPR